MKFIVSASTDAGNVRTTNQDSMNVQLLEIMGRQVVFAVLCDGMGGLQKGELASASVTYAFRRWSREKLPFFLHTRLQDNDIRREWNGVLSECNEKIRLYGKRNGASLGTTIAALMITPERFYAVNVGDSRVYELRKQLRQITRDQTIVARDVELGHLSPEQAERDPRRSVLLQCVGALEEVSAEFYFGIPYEDTVYMLCSDGFRHKITTEEIGAWLKPDCMNSAENMKQNEQRLIDLARKRGERDNITVATIRTYGNTAGEMRRKTIASIETLVDIGYCSSGEIIV